MSYSSEDKPTADAVCAALESRGVRCWIAPRDVLPGTDWGAAIIDAISASRIMVLVYSSKANDSPQIKREVERAVNRGVAVIPFRIEDVPMSKTLEYFISTPHWLDALTPPLQQHLDRLADTTRLILEQAGAPLATPPAAQAARTTPARTAPSPRAWPFGRGRSAALIGAGAGILLLVGTGAFVASRMAVPGPSETAQPPQVTATGSRGDSGPRAAGSPGPARLTQQAVAARAGSGSGSPTVPSPVPLPGMVGQRATYCLRNTDIAMDVVRAELTRRLGTSISPQQTSWLVLLMDITVQGPRGFGSLGHEAFAGMEVRDGQGRTSRPAEESRSVAAAQIYGGNSQFAELRAGVPARFIQVFEVPRDAQSLSFVGGRSGCR